MFSIYKHLTVVKILYTKFGEILPFDSLEYLKSVENTNTVIIFLENDKAVLYGITSWSIGCDGTREAGVVFANVFPLLKYIKSFLVKISILFIINLKIMKKTSFKRWKKENIESI